MIVLKNIYKKYRSNKYVLKDINLNFSEKGLVCILGESGSGKTSLLNIISGLDEPTKGEVYIDRVNINKLIKDNNLYNQYISFIFQNYNLISNLSVNDNIILLKNKKEDTLLKKLKIFNKKNSKVYDLSGGQKQRVAIARALLLDTKYIFADEPTGNLDSKTSENIMEIFQSISKEKLVVMISHNKELIDKYADRIITLKDGTIISDETKNETIDKNDTQTTKSDREISFRSVLKLRKAATSKVNSSGVFNVIFTFLLLLTIFLGINIVSTSRGEILNTVAQKSNLNMIDFIIENVDKTNN